MKFCNSGRGLPIDKWKISQNFSTAKTMFFLGPLHHGGDHDSVFTTYSGFCIFPACKESLQSSSTLKNHFALQQAVAKGKKDP